MANCPNCNAEIGYLLYEESRTYFGNVMVSNGIIDYDTEHVYTETHYNCPKCNNEVATEESDAKAILEGS